MESERLQSGDAAVAGYQLIQDLVEAWKALPRSARRKDNLGKFLSDFERRGKIDVPETVERNFYAAAGIKAATRATHRSIARCMFAGYIRMGADGSEPSPRMTGEEMLDVGI